ncbi:DMT family transporter [Candidatus Gottesmanbacteria bacterium]|nr:DMT family transporter [Candidatus Gottesmanbacteria bacterium]
MNSQKQQVTNVPLLGSVNVRHLSVGFLVIVSAAYTLLSVGSRLLSEGFQPMTQVYMRILLATIALIIVFRKKIRVAHIAKTPMRDRWVLFTMGTIGYSVAVYFVTLGALNAKLVNVAIIFASVPFFSYLYAFLFLKKRFDLKLTGLLLVSLIGISFVATKSFAPRLEAFGTGEWFTLLATATMAWFFVGRKLLSNHLNTEEITVTVMAVAAVSGFILAVIRMETFSISAFANPHVLLGLAIGGLMNVLVNPIEIYAFDHLDAVFGSQILLLENVFALLFGYLLYAETVSFPEIIGGLIIIISVYIANRIPQ